MVDSPVQRVQLLCLDVDGVLTDGRIVIDDHGVETKRFHVRDGAGIWAWLALGYQAAIITGRQGMAVRHRAREVGGTRWRRSASCSRTSISAPPTRP
jgi:3-deoxy-D-manno-octulosonate 8-phosphate phosphatase (KDO 8-P phosphatase)